MNAISSTKSATEAYSIALVKWVEQPWLAISCVHVSVCDDDENMQVKCSDELAKGEGDVVTEEASVLYVRQDVWGVPGVVGPVVEFVPHDTNAIASVTRMTERFSMRWSFYFSRR